MKRKLLGESSVGDGLEDIQEEEEEDDDDEAEIVDYREDKRDDKDNLKHDSGEDGDFDTDEENEQRGKLCPAEKVKDGGGFSNGKIEELFVDIYKGSSYDVEGRSLILKNLLGKSLDSSEKYRSKSVYLQLVNISLKSVGCVLSEDVFSQAFGVEGET